MRLVSVTDAGVTYEWRFEEKGSDAQGGHLRGTAQRFVRTADLASAPRLDPVAVFGTGPAASSGPQESPGFTFISLSRGAYAALRRGAEASFMMATLEGGDGIAEALLATKVTLRGTLAPAAQANDSLTVLLDGEPVRLPAVHARASLRARGESVVRDLWILADSAHPLVLRMASGSDVMQVVRIDRPASGDRLEQRLATACRAELPGIYFAFGSAELSPMSDPALTAAAQLLGRHGDWLVTVEGHTDSIGGAASNLALSTRRAEAVREALVSRFAVAAARLRTSGHGASRPRDVNATLEGRARNRRVELVRQCATGK
ncbi:MAG TPA: OmpA family protein [Gemmatimonadales bacterium]|nr:OmpA family protein [Gemmatimonadales bacterium]